MKQISILSISFFLGLTLLSQQNIGIVTINITGNKNLKLVIDDKTYSLANSTVSGNKTSLSMNNLATGQHSIQFTRTDLNTNATQKITTLFLLRYGYDMLVKLNENGSLELIETKKTVGESRSPMNNVDFNNLLKNVKNQPTTNGKKNVIAGAFNNAKNYFTTYQAAQLLQQISVESTRVELAKLSYRSITDKSNFYQLYDLFSSEASKDELEAYVNNYNTGGGTKVAMSDADFNSLYDSIQLQWPVSTQMNSLTNAFNNTSNYFSTNQASQLIQVVIAESNRLQLAKLSYRSITDKSNFYRVYDLLNTQTSKNELQDYVNSYNEPGTNAAMSDADFNNLYETIKQQRPAGTQINSITNAFNNVNNYFNSHQASSLIQLITGENNRLQLAKLSYRSITDRNNFYQVAELLYTQSAKDELAAYVKNYGTGNNTGSNPKVVMSDADFNSLYQDIQLQFFPGQKMTSLTDAFNNPGYYFTCAQAKKLIALVSLESNRLQLAKLSYRTIVDRNNFSQLYDLLTTQSNKNELDAYIKAYKE